MKRILFLLLFAPVLLTAQQKKYVVQLVDERIPGLPLIGRVTITDTLFQPIASGYSDSAGRFTFTSREQVVILTVDSTQETCEGYPGHIRQKFDLHALKDTVVVQLPHFWADSQPDAWLFEEGTLNFTSYNDSIFCSFDKVEPKRGGYQSMNVIVDWYKCGAFAKVELTTRYTSKEDSLYGDSLALVRASRIAGYFSAHGMQKVEYVITPLLYSQRPIINADGTLREEELSLVTFRILGW